MPEKTSYLPGEPIWTDLSTPDVAASAAFYGELLGWQATEGDPQYGGYGSFLLDGRVVAGLMPLMTPEQPTTWTAYVCTEDAAATAAAVQEAGGSTIAPPMQVAELGTMAVFADPQGAVFGVWQPGTHVGSELTGQDGTQAWLELTAEDPAAASGFYGRVFGWDAKASEAYVELTLAGRSVAGITDPSQGTSGWLPYVQVTDPAAKAEQAEALGASVVLPFTTFDGGSCTIVRDPQGAVLGLLHTAG